MNVIVESQNVEFKETWHDEYLKWICGFSNAQGGTIYIGVNDKGEIVGVNNYKKILEDIPNKVRDTLGIIVDVNLHEKDEKVFIEIIVEACPYPVSYKGEYHYRSGSTKQELKGAKLDQFLLKKQGKTWDSVPQPYLTIADLDDEAINVFKDFSVKSQRMTSSDLEGSQIQDKSETI